MAKKFILRKSHNNIVKVFLGILVVVVIAIGIAAPVLLK